MKVIFLISITTRFPSDMHILCCIPPFKQSKLQKTNLNGCILRLRHCRNLLGMHIWWGQKWPKELQSTQRKEKRICSNPAPDLWLHIWGAIISTGGLQYLARTLYDHIPNTRSQHINCISGQRKQTLTSSFLNAAFLCNVALFSTFTWMLVSKTDMLTNSRKWHKSKSNAW